MVSRIFIFCLAFLICGTSLFGQSDIGSSDLSKVKVEELSNSQIRQIMQRAEQSGMTESQMNAALLTRGMSPAELQKLEKRLNSMRAGQTSIEVADRNREVSSSAGQEDIFSSISEASSPARPTGPARRIFGYEIFRNENLTFEPSLNIPTPPDYQIGPGDELVVDIWGASQQNYQLPVSPEGTVYIENLGPINVNGLTIEKASDRILHRLRSIYSGLAGPDRNTYAEVTLGDARTITVHMIGEVNLPGTFTISAFASVFNALYASGGPSVTGSFRNIELIRNNELIATLDMYDFLLKGTLENNIRLQDQDIIKVNHYHTRVDITGEIKRPGLYELKDHEALLGKLIEFSGGFTDKAFQKRLTVYRKTDTERKIVDLNKDEINAFNLIDGDSIPVSQILQRFENRVTIDGAVFRPGEFALNGGLTLSELIAKAEGLREDAFLQRALIYRTGDDLTLEIIPVDLRAVMGGQEPSIQLQKDDMVSISSIFDLKEEFYVAITGEVNQRGTYPFMENSTLEDLIVMAGGLKESASLSRVEVARRQKEADAEESRGMIAEIFYFDINKSLELTEEGEKFILEPFDQVYIRKSPGYETEQVITLTGEVEFPGNYSLSSKKERISDLIARAGGLTYEAYPAGARLIRKVEGNRRVRRRALESLVRESEDPLVFDIDDEDEQAIGIDLEKILESPGSKYDLFARKGDRIEIPKEMQTVRLTGALLYPITVRYDKRYSFNRYISMSGGFAQDAKKSKAYVIYANGSVAKTTNLLFFNAYPKIEPGAEIMVPRKPDKERMSTQEAIGISSALTSMALIIVTIINTIGGGGGG
ncbi:MAG: SLBB domain-containing protein [Bacteroidales bacterium]